VVEAALWGAAAASSLLIGALLGLALDIERRSTRDLLIGLALAFGAGTLIAAMAFELTEEAFRLGGADAVALGLAAGAVAFFVGDLYVESRGAVDRMTLGGERDGTTSGALLLGAVLDGIPESVVIGISLLGGSTVSIPVLAAVLISNFPEALGATLSQRRAAGERRTAEIRRVVGPWAIVVALSALASGLGYGLLEDASGNTVGLLEAFAAGAVLTMLADTMIPDARRSTEESGHPLAAGAVGLVTVLGFALAYLLSTLE
jgi:ZIP family zinc transporter